MGDGVDADPTRRGLGPVEATIAETCARLGAEFPDATPSQIEGALREALTRTSGAPVDDFRVLLAERSVRAALGARGDR